MYNFMYTVPESTIGTPRKDRKKMDETEDFTRDLWTLQTIDYKNTAFMRKIKGQIITTWPFCYTNQQIHTSAE